MERLTESEIPAPSTQPQTPPTTAIGFLVDPSDTNVLPDSQLLTPEKALFIEAKVQEYFDYTLECFDRARADASNVLQWLFSSVVGGMALVGTLYTAHYWQLATGALAVSCWAAFATTHLLRATQSVNTLPPGNTAETLNMTLSQPEHRMRWKEACSIDARIEQNRQATDALAIAVDKARESLTKFPLFFLGGTLLAFSGHALWHLARWVFTSR